MAMETGWQERTLATRRAYPREHRAVGAIMKDPELKGPLGSGALKVVTAYYSLVTAYYSLVTGVVGLNR